MRFVAVAIMTLLVSACGGNVSDASMPLPDAPAPVLIAEMAAETERLLGPQFLPVFVCGPSIGQAMQPEVGKPAWADDRAGPNAILLAMDENAAFDIVRKEADGRTTAAAASGGTVVPTLFDPVSGDISVAVLYTTTGHSETFLFSTYGQGPSFLTWTRNVPQNAKSLGGRGVGAYIAQCLELAVEEAP